MANPQLDTIIRAYLLAADEKKAAETKYNQLREELMVVLNDEGLQKYTGAFAKLTICERKVYEYPADLIEADEILKARRKVAEKTGTALVINVTRYPRVTVTE